MIKIATKAFGEIEVADEARLYFKREIMGFEGTRRFCMIELGDLPHFYWLQSEENPELAFIVVDPRFFKSDYTLSIKEEDYKIIELEEHDRAIDFVIVNISENIEEMTMNLLGPIIINPQKHLAIQTVSLNDGYHTKERLLQGELLEKVG